MEDWIARAINSAKNHIQKDAAVAKDVLNCNRWIASSALQKAIRRGEIAIAQRAAFALHREDRLAAWRRLIAIALEDVGPAAVDVVVETVAVATSPDWRAVRGEEEVLASVVCRLATAPKDRSADYLMWIAAEHLVLCETREICGHSSITDRLSMVLDRSRALPDRAVAAWFCSGINYPYEHCVGGGDLARLADAYCRLGA
jgi:replication-associated recombination protein RarA